MHLTLCLASLCPAQAGSTPLDVASDAVREHIGGVAAWSFRPVAEDPADGSGSQQSPTASSDNQFGQLSDDAGSSGRAASGGGRLELVREAKKRAWRFEDVAGWAADPSLRTVQQPGVLLWVTSDNIAFNPTRMEEYICDQDFPLAFSLTREEFENLTPYKQQIEKRRCGLFA